MEKIESGDYVLLGRTKALFIVTAINGDTYSLKRIIPKNITLFNQINNISRDQIKKVTYSNLVRLLYE